MERRRLAKTKFHLMIRARASEDKSELMDVLKDRCLDAVRARRQALIAEIRGAKKSSRVSYQSIAETILEKTIAMGVDQGVQDGGQLPGALDEEQLYSKQTNSGDMYSNISPDDPFMDMDENTKPIEDQSASEDQFQELMLQIMEAIEKELADEDWTQYEEFEHCVRAEEDCIAQLIQGNDNYDKDTNQESLLCPLCQKDLLQQQCQRAGAMSTAIICGCGLRIDAGDDGITLEFVRQQLASAYDNHWRNAGGTCREKLQFSSGSGRQRPTPVGSSRSSNGHYSISLSCECLQCGFFHIIV